MTHSKHLLVKGTQDFYGKDFLKRKFLVNKISEIFSKYSFEPLETPAFEYLDLLSSNYGDEGEKLLYKILNSGDFMKNIDTSKPISSQISEKGLRYDLTMPMMRYVATNFHELTFPWRRSQIQPVWRADRPQRGRYREFYQCDIDIVGSKSLLCEAELLAIACESLESLKISDFVVYINHIGIFKGLLQSHNQEQHFKEIFTIVDKIDKVGPVAIFEELNAKNFNPGVIKALEELLALEKRSNAEIIKNLYTMLEDNTLAKDSIDELSKILQYASQLNVKDSCICINPLLARGLSYYTGTIFEVKTVYPSVGSIVGGGRYDHMLENFFGIPKNQNMVDTAVGLSFGIDRIYSLLDDKDLLTQISSPKPKTLVISMGKDFESQAINIASILREKNAYVEVSIEEKKLKKYLEYANKKAISYVIIIGEEEASQGKFTFKNMVTGEQNFLSEKQVLDAIA